MKELLELVYKYEETKFGWKSLYIRYAYTKDDTEPVVKDVHWSSSIPVDAREVNRYTDEFHAGHTKLCQWVNFILDEGFVQFGDSSHQAYSWGLHQHRT